MTVYANLVDGELRGVYDLLPQNWNEHDNFHLKCKVDEEFMKANGFVKIVRDTTPFDPQTHKMSDYLNYTIENGQVYEHRDILPIPVSPPEPEQPNSDEPSSS